MYAVIDIETTGLDRYKEKINYIGVLLVSIDSVKEYHIFNMTKKQDEKDFIKMCEQLRKEKTKLIWQNGKFDTLFIEIHYNIKLPIHHDVMVMGTAYELSTSHALDDMAKQYLNIKSWDIPLKDKIKPNNLIVEEYLKKDLEVPYLLYRFFCRKMSREQTKIYNLLLLPAYKMFKDVERDGIYLDKETLFKVKKLYASIGKEKEDILKAKYDINWNSSKQVADVFYKKEKFPTLKLSEKTGEPSSDAKVLKKLATKGYTLAQQLLEYKFYYGANTKFLNKWGAYASFDGRIHPSFNITNVITGRTSCSNPNLQQVPRNKELRMLFTAPPGRALIEADYSQIELRIAADYANDSAMIKIYNTNGDIHTETASAVMGVPYDRVTKEQRNKAKAVNFGFLYGMYAKGFKDYALDSYGVTIEYEEAVRFRELFFQKYSSLLKWHKDTEILCELLGGVSNLFGQFINLPDIYSQDWAERGSAIRKAINSPVQGTASQLLVASAIEINKTLRKDYDAYVVGTVHDAVLVDCPEEYVEVVSKEIQRIMSRPKLMDEFNINLKVPLVADIGVGAWGSK